MVLLEPFSKLSFWSFNHPLGGSLHWIQFFNILLELQALKLNIILMVLMSSATQTFFFSFEHPPSKASLSSLDCRIIPAQCAQLLFFHVDQEVPAKISGFTGCCSHHLCCCACGSTVFFTVAYLATQICWSLLNCYLAVPHCL